MTHEHSAPTLRPQPARLLSFPAKKSPAHDLRQRVIARASARLEALDASGLAIADAVIDTLTRGGTDQRRTRDTGGCAKQPLSQRVRHRMKDLATDQIQVLEIVVAAIVRQTI